VRIVLDTTILVRATDKTHGPARELLLTIVSGKHTLVLSSEILHEVAKVLRYPGLQEFYGLSEARVYEFIGYLREVAEIIPLNPLLVLPTPKSGGFSALCLVDSIDFASGIRGRHGS
jgi:putative PIN family toxin of toxin-antitoxin system